MNSPVHVQIDDPVALRKQVLNCAIKFNEVLKGSDSSKILRAKREHYKKQVSGLLKDLKQDIKILVSELPEVDIKEVKVKEVKREEIDLNSVISKPRVEHRHVNKLDSEIADIKKRLRNL